MTKTIICWMNKMSKRFVSGYYCDRTGKCGFAGNRIYNWYESRGRKDNSRKMVRDNLK